MIVAWCRRAVSTIAVSSIALLGTAPAMAANSVPEHLESIEVSSPLQEYRAADYRDALWNLETQMLVRTISRNREHSKCDVQHFTVTHPTDGTEKLYLRVVGKETRVCEGDEAKELITEVRAFADAHDDTYAVSTYHGVRGEYFGHWADLEDIGVSTRHLVLWRDVGSADWNDDGDRILEGDFTDLYTGDQVVLGEDSIHVDHVVPISMSWLDMEHRSQEERVGFYNDPMNLLPTTAETNRDKGAHGPANWLPTNKSSHCTYAMTWTYITVKYELSVRPGNIEVLREILTDCLTEATAAEQEDTSSTTAAARKSLLDWPTTAPETAVIREDTRANLRDRLQSIIDEVAQLI